MAEEAPTSAAAAASPGPATAAQTQVVQRKRKERPLLSELIIRAVEAANERGGVSAYAIKKALIAFGCDMEKRNTRFNSCIKLLVEKRILIRTRGTGAGGSYKVNKNRPVPKRKKSEAAKKEAAKKKAARKKKLAARKAARNKKLAAKRAEKKKELAAMKAEEAEEACSGSKDEKMTFKTEIKTEIKEEAIS
ncbi:histone H1-like [Pempheris klunzingeri]|uniref:histone H1-like n=1 Tax=Pempheris klunzingeri TaxID=3127111 RepID=UPI003980ADD9